MTKKTALLTVSLVLFLVSPSLGDNSGLFLPHQVFPVNSSPEAVVLGDVNNDGRTDVVMTTGYNDAPDEDYKLFVYLQDDVGELAAPVKYDVPIAEWYAGLRSVDVGDLNGDGLTDVAVAAQNSIGVFYQNDSQGLDPVVGVNSGHTSGLNVQKMRIGDFNGDTRLDVVSLDWGTSSQEVDVYLQNASGTLNPPVVYTVQHGGRDDLQVGDVNGDGRTDVVVMSGQLYAHDNIGILLQNGSGTFDAPVYYDLGGNELGNAVAVGDLTGDGLDDLALSHGGNSPFAYVSVFAQNDAGTLDTQVTYSAYDIPGPGGIADVNFDGKGDLLVVHDGWQALSVYLQSESGTLLPFERYDIPLINMSPYGPHDMAVGDINSDGLSDVVLADLYGGLVVLYHAPAPSATFFRATGSIVITEMEVLGTTKSCRLELVKRPDSLIFDLLTYSSSPRMMPAASYDHRQGILDIPTLIVEGRANPVGVELTRITGEWAFDVTEVTK